MFTSEKQISLKMLFLIRCFCSEKKSYHQCSLGSKEFWNPGEQIEVFKSQILHSHILEIPLERSVLSGIFTSYNQFQLFSIWIASIRALFKGRSFSLLACGVPSAWSAVFFPVYPNSTHPSQSWLKCSRNHALASCTCLLKSISHWYEQVSTWMFLLLR